MKNLYDISKFESLNNLPLLAKQVVEGFITGLHKSPFHGFSVEFAEHRLYNEGESTKHIDWKLFARTDKLFVKRYEEETNLRSRIVIDSSSSMFFPNEKPLQNKLAFSIYSAAAIIHLLKKQRDAASITFFSEKVELHTRAGLAAPHIKMLFAELGKLLNTEYAGQKKQTNAAQNLHQIAETTHKRSLVIIFSDMADNHDQSEMFSALQHLKYNKHEVILFHVTDKLQEQEFKFSNRPHRFIDMETGESINLNPNDIRKAYLNKTGNYHSELKLKCAQYDIDFVEADCRADFSQVLQAYLIKRNKLF